MGRTQRRRRRSNKNKVKVFVPFDIQTIIIKKLPANSLLLFRSVSKQWKSLIDRLKSVKIYKTMNDRHLLARYNVQQYIADKDDNLSIIGNDAFPEHISPITVPLSVKALSGVRILGSSYGIICFHGYQKDYPNIDSKVVVFWNSSIRKSVSVLLEPPLGLRTSWVGFGVCPKTHDPKLVKIDKIRNVTGIPEVQVYTLSTRAWKKVYYKPPYMPYELWDLRYHVGVCVGQFVYWLATTGRYGSNSIVSFDLSNDSVGENHLPYSLERSECLMLSKWNEYLVVFEYCDIYGHLLNYSYVCLIENNGESKTRLPHKELIFPKYDNVLEFRKNDEARIETRHANDDDVDPILQVYDPCSNVSFISKFPQNTLRLEKLVCYL
ncbi:putative polyprotein [Tanacetum coccineum]